MKKATGPIIVVQSREKQPGAHLMSLPYPLPPRQNGESESAGAQEALGRLLGQALNLLGPQRVGGAATTVASQQQQQQQQANRPESSSSVPSSEPPPEVIEAANTSHEDAEEGDTVDGLVEARVRQFAKTAGAGDGSTDAGTAEVSASSSPADGGMGDGSADHLWSASTAE